MTSLSTKASTAVLLGLLTLLPTGLLSQDASPGPILPKTAGTSWQYNLVAVIYPSELKTLPTGEMGYGEPKTIRGVRSMEIIGEGTFGRAEEPVTHYVTTIQGKSVNEEFSKITSDSVVSYGGRSLARGEWIEQTLDPPLKTLQADLRRGASWAGVSAISEDTKMMRRFDVLDFESVTVPAGTYDAVKIRFVGADSRGGLIKRYFWISNEFGTIKSRTVHYSGGRLTLVEIEELAAFTAGTGVSNIKAPETSKLSSAPLPEAALEPASTPMGSDSP